ncbi:transcriptional regulator [Actibacterium mucosum KCTC 23349]|uniref:Transcriptional regulator n=1 Tax=Actibacterium mucosum KCTC 23349 TaxID=1454373 RepID=A0A037ZJF0_9RHOB|nr:ChrR family anti-sigma-E factor [Actibacterium mucosum]KAJ56238.1 transcriptional regulator [Actibacterium mucosum KCTC 23349]
MNTVAHQIPSDILAAYAAGQLPHPYALVVAAHVSMCDAARAEVEGYQMLGGTMMEAEGPVDVSATMRDAIFAQLDAPAPVEPEYKAQGPIPAPIMAALKGKAPKWRGVGLGAKQALVHKSDAGTVRLLHIPAGQAMPDHGHAGLEMTMVLQGAFYDGEDRFGVGDVEIADEEIDHTPIAAGGEPCICLAATDAPLRFNSRLPRLLQPILGI